jgi:capsule polysaccharide export protein KpsE/RkpR
LKLADFREDWLQGGRQKGELSGKVSGKLPESKELDEKFTTTELSTVKAQLVQVEQAAKIKDERIAKLEQSLPVMQSNLQQITEVLKTNPSIAQIEAALERTRKMRHINSD